MNAVSTRAVVAMAAGVQQSVVHYTFGTREELLRAVTETLTDQVHQAITSATTTGSDREEVLRSFVQVLAEGVRQRPGHHLLLLELTLHALRHPARKDLARWQYARYEEAALVAPDRICEQTGSGFVGSREDAARFVLAVLDGLTIQQLTNDDEKAARAGLGRLTALLNGMLNPSTSASNSGSVDQRAPSASGAPVSDRLCQGVVTGGVYTTAGRYFLRSY